MKQFNFNFLFVCYGRAVLNSAPILQNDALILKIILLAEHNLWPVSLIAVRDAYMYVTHLWCINKHLLWISAKI